jgi:hypothetical protein
MKSFMRWFAATTAVFALATVLSAAPAHAQAADADKKVTVNLKDIPLRAAIDALFAGTGYQYSVNPDVQNVPVNLNIRDVGLQAALRLLVRQAATAQPGLTFSKDGDIFVVKIRRETAVAPMVEEAPPEYTDEASEFTWEKIPVQFNNAAVFVLAFGGTMLPTEADVLMGGMGGGMGGGMMGGGMGGGMMGGMGGMGGGMMGGGMMGGMGGMGGMMGGMGGMGGGMMGGMGGFGGMGGMGGGMMGGMGGMGGGMMGGMGGMGGGMMGGGMGGFGGGRMF